MFRCRVGQFVVIGLTLTLVLAVAAYAAEQAAPGSALAASAPFDENPAVSGSPSIESLPSMYLTGLGVGAHWCGGQKRVAIARATVADGVGSPVVGALVQVNFDISCLKKRYDSGSAHTLLVEEEGQQYALATVLGVRTFTCGTGCTVTGTVVSITHPDYTWEPFGGVPVSAYGFCTSGS